MVRAWLKQLQRKLLGPKKPPRPSPRRARLGLEALESREMMSASPVSPTFTLNNGNLYNTSGAQQQLIDTGVQNFVVANNKVVDLHTNGTLESMNSDGSGKVQLGAGMRSDAIDGNGSVVALDTSGNLYRYAPGSKSPQTIDTGVQTFAVGNTKVYDLHTTDVLEILNSDGSGKATLATNVLSIGLGDDGNVYYLENGKVWSSASGQAVDGNVASMVVSAGGLVFDLETNGNLNALDPSTGKWGLWGTSVQSLGRGDDGNAYYLESGKVWSSASGQAVDGNVASMVVSAGGLVFDLETNGNLNALDPSTGKWGLWGTSVQSLGRGDDGNAYYLESGKVWSSASGQAVDGNVASMVVSAGGLVFDLETNGNLNALDPSTGKWGLWGTSVQSLGRGDDGNAYYLESGKVWSSASGQAVDGNVASMVVSAGGLVFDLETNGNLNALDPSTGKWGLWGTSVQSLGRGDDGNAYYLESGKVWSSASNQVIASNVQSFAIAGNGTPYYLKNGTLYNGNSATVVSPGVASFGVGGDGRVYFLTNAANPTGAGNLYIAGLPAGQNLVATNVQSFAIGADGTMYALTIGHALEQRAVGGSWVQIDTNIAVAVIVQGFLAARDYNGKYMVWSEQDGTATLLVASSSYADVSKTIPAEISGPNPDDVLGGVNSNGSQPGDVQGGVNSDGSLPGDLLEGQDPETGTGSGTGTGTGSGTGTGTGTGGGTETGTGES